MPTNLLLLPLLGGYWFIHHFNFTRFRSQRLDGYRLLLESSLVGVALAILARVATLLLAAIPGLERAWMRFSPPFSYSGTALASLLLGGAFAFVANLFLERTGLLTRRAAQYKAIRLYGNELLRLFHTAQNQERAVTLTLDNRKVYIGLIAAAPNLEPHEGFIGITPFYSGYRDKDTLEVRLTVDYIPVYERGALDASESEITIPISSIRSAGFFNESAWVAFSVESGPAAMRPSAG